MLKTRHGAALALMVLAGSGFAQSPPASASPKQGATGASQQSASFRNVYQLCQRREAELAAQNNMLIERSQLLSAEKDVERKKQISENVKGLFQVLALTEASWNRLSCAAILYPARPAVQR